LFIYETVSGRSDFKEHCCNIVNFCTRSAVSIVRRNPNLLWLKFFASVIIQGPNAIILKNIFANF
jgi:hypothetical protein